MLDFNWFNVSSKMHRINNKHLRLWNLFHRDSKDGRYWGVGILQIGQRHLFYISYNAISILFIGKSK